jgi:hypothetical protein
MTARADEWIWRTTIGCVAVLAAIAGTVPYRRGVQSREQAQHRSEDQA